MLGIDLRGPVVPMPAQDRTKDENVGFEVDIENQSVACSEGKQAFDFPPELRIKSLRRSHKKTVNHARMQVDAGLHREARIF